MFAKKSKNHLVWLVDQVYSQIFKINGGWFLRNLFELKKKNNAIKDKIIRDIRNLFWISKRTYKPVRVGNFYYNSMVAITVMSSTDTDEEETSYLYCNSI